MTELQVKTKKGSLKKFLAMFLAVCVCMTNPPLNYLILRHPSFSVLSTNIPLFLSFVNSMKQINMQHKQFSMDISSILMVFHIYST